MQGSLLEQPISVGKVIITGEHVPNSYFDVSKPFDKHCQSIVGSNQEKNNGMLLEIEVCQANIEKNPIIEVTFHSYLTPRIPTIFTPSVYAKDIQAYIERNFSLSDAKACKVTPLPQEKGNDRISVHCNFSTMYQGNEISEKAISQEITRRILIIDHLSKFIQ